LWWITDLINYRIQQQRANQNAAFVGECEKYKIPGLACRPTILPSVGLQWRKSWWGRGPPPPPPPPPSRKMPNFRKFSPKRGLKTAFSSANREVCWKFESFVGNLEGFAPPPSLEKVNFRHWACTRAILHLVNASNFIILFCLLPDDSIYQGPVVQKLVSLILS
jgi:hypothetical protein